MRRDPTQAVIVNVVLLTGRALELGVHGHVCEVQLMLDAWPFMRVSFSAIARLCVCDSGFCVRVCVSVYVFAAVCVCVAYTAVVFA